MRIVVTMVLLLGLAGGAYASNVNCGSSDRDSVHPIVDAAE